MHLLAVKQGRVLFYYMYPIRVILAEGTSDEENHETSAVDM